MAVDESAIHFLATVASAADREQLDPNASLGGFRSLSRVYYQGALTAGMSSVHEFVDSLAKDDRPASPASSSPLVNSGAYAAAGRLVHWWRFGRDAGAIGVDWATYSGPRRDWFLRNLSSADLSALQPGLFDQARRSITLGGANNCFQQSTAVAWGIANAWTVALWVRPTTVAAGQGGLFHLTPDTTVGGTTAVNQIRLFRDGSGLEVRITDATTGTNAKVRQFSSFFTVNVWTLVVATWNGTTLSVYRDGSLVVPSASPSDAAVTMTDAGRGGIIGGREPNLLGPSQDLAAQVHSAFVWDRALDAAEVASFAGFGDGVGLPEWDFTGQWAVFVTGANRLAARRVDFYDRATGTFRFAAGFPSAAALGDRFRVSLPQFLWNDGPTPEECAAGLVDYRCVFARNDSGEQLTGSPRFYLVALDPGSVAFDLAAAGTAFTTGAFNTIANDETAPNLDSGFGTALQRFRRPRAWASSDSPAGSLTNLGNGSGLPVFLRRAVPALARGYVGGTWLLFLEAPTAAISGAGPWVGVAPISFTPAGFTPDLRCEPDRVPRTFGGSRVVARLRDAASGIAVEGVDVTIELVSGPGALEGGTFLGATDALGETSVVYRGPNSEASAGATVVLEARVGGDS